MKSAATKSTVHTNIATPANAFSIKASGAAFKVLSDSLYMDKITACIRELTCNAIDAHREAGNADPVIITLPNRLNSTFSIQDFGVGMSHDEVLELYTTYFSSSKQESNDLIGSFGLGSKSPFAYTDSFTVIAIKDGVKNLYSCTLNERSIPEVLLISSTETSEQNGMKVEFPVRAEDLGSFQVKTAKLLPWFTTTPIVKGISPEELTAAVNSFRWTKDLEGESWQFGMFGTDADDGRIFVLMGQILYPVNARQVSTPSYRRALILSVPIGAVDIAPSREQLDYSKRTIHYLEERFKALKLEIETVINRKLEATSSPFEKARAAVDLRGRYLREDAKPYEISLEGLSFLGTFHMEHQRSRHVLRMRAYESNVDPSRAVNLAFLFPTRGGVTYTSRVGQPHGWLFTASGTPTFLFTTRKFTSFKLRQQIREYLSINKEKALYVFSKFGDFKKIGDPTSIITEADLPVLETKAPTEKKPYTGPVALENRILKHRYLTLNDYSYSASSSKNSRATLTDTVFVGWVLVDQMHESHIKNHLVCNMSLETITRLLRDCNLPNADDIRIGIASVRQKDFLEKLHEPMFEDWLKKNNAVKMGTEHILRVMTEKKSSCSSIKNRDSVKHVLTCFNAGSKAYVLLTNLLNTILSQNNVSYRYYFDSLKSFYESTFGEKFKEPETGDSIRQEFFTRYPLLRMILANREAYQLSQISVAERTYIREYTEMCDSKN